MAHDQAHHNHHIQVSRINKAFIIGITLNVLFIVIEAITGFKVYGKSPRLAFRRRIAFGHSKCQVALLVAAFSTRTFK